MNAVRLVVSLGALVLLCAFTSSGQYLYLDSTLTISTPTSFDSIRIASTGQLIADDSITITGTMTIDSGGVVTHSGRLEEGVRLNVAGILTVAVGGAIDVTEKGLRGGNNGSVFGDVAEAYNATGDTIVPGVPWRIYGAGGASSGGVGSTGSDPGPTNDVYGEMENPRHLGSGGGRGGHGYAPGKGSGGGGRITIDAGTLVVDGVIRADGGSLPPDPNYGAYQSGSGSGGSILITAGAFSGSGLVSANGGCNATIGGNIYGGSAGGGRVAVYYSAMTFPVDSVMARGGYPVNGSGFTGSAGTVYLRDNADSYGSVIIENGNTVCDLFSPLRTSLTHLKNLTLQDHGRLRAMTGWIGALTVDEPVVVTDTSVLMIDSAVALTVTNASGADIIVDRKGLFTLGVGSVLTADVVRIDGGAVMSASDLSFPVGTDLELLGDGALSMLQPGVLSVGVFDTTNIRSGTVTIGLGGRLDINSNSAFIGNGVTLVNDGTFGATDTIGTLTIDSGGVVTHSGRLEEGLRLNVAGTLTVAAGGAVDVTAKGLRGGNNGSVFGDVAEAYNATGDTIVPGVPVREYGAGGASFGGVGSTGSQQGPTNAVYGELENPGHLGSGGGRGGVSYGPKQGSHGGGRITIEAGTLVVNGVIRADGGTVPIDNSYGTYQDGSGSGGSILIHAGTLSGSGLISANGGNNGRDDGGNYGGSGGGGRVAVYYDAMTFPADSITARGGHPVNSTGFTGSAGTVYLRDNAQPLGDVIIENNNFPCNLYTPWRSSFPSIWGLTVTAEGALEIGSEVVIEGPLLVTNGGKIGRP